MYIKPDRTDSHPKFNSTPHPNHLYKYNSRTILISLHRYYKQPWGEQNHYTLKQHVLYMLPIIEAPKTDFVQNFQIVSVKFESVCFHPSENN